LDREPQDLKQNFMTIYEILGACVDKMDNDEENGHEEDLQILHSVISPELIKGMFVMKATRVQCM
jgi:hypothetical protein